MLPCKLKVIHIIYQRVQSDTIIYYYNHIWWYAAYYHIYIYVVTFFVTGSSRSVLKPIPCRRMPRRPRWSVAWVCACEQETFRPLSPALIRHECHWSHEHGPIVHLVNSICSLLVITKVALCWPSLRSLEAWLFGICSPLIDVGFVPKSWECRAMSGHVGPTSQECWWSDLWNKEGPRAKLPVGCELRLPNTSSWHLFGSHLELMTCTRLNVQSFVHGLLLSLNIDCMTQSVDVNDLCTVHYLDLVFCSSTSLSSLRRIGRHFIVEGSIKTY